MTRRGWGGAGAQLRRIDLFFKGASGCVILRATAKRAGVGGVIRRATAKRAGVGGVIRRATARRARRIAQAQFGWNSFVNRSGGTGWLKKFPWASS